MRPDPRVVAELVPEGSRVLELACGHGELGTQLPPLVSMWGFSAAPFDCQIVLTEK